MAAPRADCAGDAELAPPLGREHHEDQEDQQDAAAIENEPNVVKNAMNAAPAWSAFSIASCFVLSASSPSCESVGCMRSMTCPLNSAPPSAPPVFETKTAFTYPTPRTR